MRETDLFSLFVYPLEKAGMRYMVSGSVGAMHYSKPRLTLDVDIPILTNQLSSASVKSEFLIMHLA